MLASQLSTVNWLHRMGGSKEAADAVMDRILHNYQLIQLDGQSKRSEKPNLNNEEVQ
uniref:ATP-binding protein n=1 Tax=Succinivibrio sp. TaxID=2053619 RepID=UPI00402A637D